MPNNLVMAVSKKCKIPVAEVEKSWAKAEELAAQQNQKDNYEYITGIFKKLVGKECMDKMQWPATEKAKITNKQKQWSDEEETDQMDKMNITAESKIIHQIVDLIAEAKCGGQKKKKKNAK